MDEDETAERLAVLLGEELGITVQSDKIPNELRRAAHRLRVEAWRGACMSFIGADADGGVCGEN